ncbi:MAG: hypothetical protein KC475_07555 [Cyanobacteria bacterium HKST-UBA03]|nr:hypothetical protein [Cyanobacteria bacterium HKST-UBA03]
MISPLLSDQPRLLPRPCLRNTASPLTVNLGRGLVTDQVQFSGLLDKHYDNEASAEQAALARINNLQELVYRLQAEMERDGKLAEGPLRENARGNLKHQNRMVLSTGQIISMRRNTPSLHEAPIVSMKFEDPADPSQNIYLTTSSFRRREKPKLQEQSRLQWLFNLKPKPTPEQPLEEPTIMVQPVCCQAPDLNNGEPFWLYNTLEGEGIPVNRKELKRSTSLPGLSGNWFSELYKTARKISDQNKPESY